MFYYVQPRSVFLTLDSTKTMILGLKSFVIWYKSKKVIILNLIIKVSNKIESSV